MFENYTVGVLSVREYERATQEYQRAMLPRSAGIYVWTLDLTQLAASEDASDADALLGRMHDRLQRRIRTFTGRVDPYVEVTVRDSPANLTPATRARLEALATVGGPLLEWSLLCATLFQRPLYVGKAVRLDQRIRGHLRNGSKLRTYLSEAGLSPHDCTVILAPVTPPVEVESLDDEEGGMSEDSAAGEFEGGEDWDFVEPDLSDPDLSLEGHVDRLVRLAESLVIRSSRPLFNSRQD